MSFSIIRITSFCLLVGGILSCVLSCAGYHDQISTVVLSYKSRQYPGALAALEQSPLAQGEKNALLYQLEKATILDRLGNLKESRQIFLDASFLADRLRTLSISREAGTYLINESTQRYGGEDYEKVGIHTMLAMSFLEQEDLSAALVEARKINNKINELNAQYDKNKNKFKEDAFARYLAGMIREAGGRDQDALIDYRIALDTYMQDYKPHFAVAKPPEGLVNATLSIARKKNRRDIIKQITEKYGLKPTAQPSYPELVVVHEVGAISAKFAEEAMIPFSGQLVRLSFPNIHPKRWPLDSRDIGVLYNGKMTKAELSQNVDFIAKQSLEDKRARYIIKAGVRLLAKGQITEQARQHFGDVGALVGNIFSAATETADTRNWSTLPSAFYVTRIPVQPGNHTIKIFNGSSIEMTKKISVKASDKIVFVRAK